ATIFNKMSNGKDLLFCLSDQHRPMKDILYLVELHLKAAHPVGAHSPGLRISLRRRQGFGNILIELLGVDPLKLRYSIRFATAHCLFPQIAMALLYRFYPFDQFLRGTGGLRLDQGWIEFFIQERDKYSDFIKPRLISNNRDLKFTASRKVSLELSATKFQRS